MKKLRKRLWNILGAESATDLIAYLHVMDGLSPRVYVRSLSFFFLPFFFLFFHFNYLLLTHMHMHVLMSYAPCSMPSRPGCVHRNHTAVSVVPTLVTFMHTQHKKNKKIDLRHTGCVASVNTFRPIDRRHTIHRESRHIS